MTPMVFGKLLVDPPYAGTQKIHVMSITSADALLSKEISEYLYLSLLSGQLCVLW
jgi:hypothetical protein